MSQQKATETESKFRHGFKTFAEKTSIEFRKQLGLNSYDFLCAFELCKFLNVKLLIPSDIPNLEKVFLKNLMGPGSENWSAVSIPVDGEYIIIHNNTHSPTRQQSNIMHELAHIICEHKSPNIEVYDLPSGLRTYNEVQEAEAIWLGGALQLPRELLIHFLRKGIDAKKIAQLNTASEDMVTYRINVTGVMYQIKRFLSQR